MLEISCVHRWEESLIALRKFHLLWKVDPLLCLLLTHAPSYIRVIINLMINRLLICFCFLFTCLIFFYESWTFLAAYSEIDDVHASPEIRFVGKHMLFHSKRQHNHGVDFDDLSPTLTPKCNTQFLCLSILVAFTFWISLNLIVMSCQWVDMLMMSWWAVKKVKRTEWKGYNFPLIFSF